MRVRRAQKDQVRQGIRRHVIRKLACTFEQQIVLNAANVFAAAERRKASGADVAMARGEGGGWRVQKILPRKVNGVRRSASNYHESRGRLSFGRRQPAVVGAKTQYTVLTYAIAAGHKFMICDTSDIDLASTVCNLDFSNL